MPLAQNDYLIKLLRGMVNYQNYYLVDFSDNSYVMHIEQFLQ